MKSIVLSLAALASQSENRQPSLGSVRLAMRVIAFYCLFATPVCSAAAPEPHKVFILARQSMLDLLGRQLAASHETNSIEGWTVLVSERLLIESKAATENALELLRGQLQEIVRVVPAPAVGKLREVILWFSPEYPGVQPKAEYHPGAGWLREHGRDPAMVKAVEFTNVRIFESESRRMPNFTLHELAHAYHDRVLARGFENVKIKAAFEKAKTGGAYERVQRRDAEGNVRPDRSYALTNPMEYFAETTEAFFTRNDFYPFTRDELKRHDPEMEALLAKLWGSTK